MRQISIIYKEGKNPSTLKGCMNIITKLTMIETKRNTVTTTAAGNCPLTVTLIGSIPYKFNSATIFALALIKYLLLSF